MDKEQQFTFVEMSDLELVLMQAELRKSPFPDDKEMLNAILKELGKRTAHRDEMDAK